MTRAAVVEFAAAEIGPDTPDKRVKYWADALGRPVTYAEISHPAWCGIFALWCLHQAGLDTDEHWQIGKGFLLQNPHPMHLTTDPQPGDIGYIAAPFQHHFIVESVDATNVHSIDGNQPDIRRQSRPLGSHIVFYSIAGLLALAGEPDEPLGPTPAGIQHALNTLILAHPDASPPALLRVDGIFGPKSTTALRWAEALTLDDATRATLGLA